MTDVLEAVMPGLQSERQGDGPASAEPAFGEQGSLGAVSVQGRELDDDEVESEGAGTEDGALDAEETADQAKDGEQGEAEVTPKVPTRMYFLRVPRPDLSERQLQKQQLDAEFFQLKEACDKALAAAKLANEYRNQRREEYQASLAQFNVSKADREELLARLKPLRDVNRQVSSQRTEMRDQQRALPASTIAQLDQMISDLEFKQAHETMDKRSENALIADIRRLNKSRADVARFEEANAQHESTRDDLTNFKASKAELEDQLKAVHDEYTLARAQMDEKWNALREARSKQEQVSNDFQRLKEIKDDKFRERAACRDDLQAAPNAFYENRRFSQKVRTMIASGEAEQAVGVCREVTETLLEHLLASPAAWREYVGDWELQRKHAVSEAALDLDSGAPERKKASKAAGGDAAKAATTDADAIMAGILAELDGVGPAAPAAADALTAVAPAAAAAEAPPARAPKAKKDKAGKGVAAPEAEGPKAPAATPSTSKAEAPTNGAAAPAAAAKKARARAAAAPPPAEDGIDDTFVPPPSAQPNGNAPPQLSEAARKEAVRREQAAKARDAEERKRKADERKQKRVQQAADAAKAREEEEAAKAEQARRKVEREAARQREAAARKKAIDAKRAESAAAKSRALKSRGAAKPAAAVKASPAGKGAAQAVARAQKWCRENQNLLAVAGVVALLFFLMLLALT